MINWQKFPFIRIVIPFVFGVIFSSYFFDFLFSFATVLILSLLLFAMTKVVPKPSRNYLFGIVLNLTLFFIGSAIVKIHSYLEKENYYEKTQVETDYYHCKVIEPVKEKNKSYQVIVSVTKAYIDTTWKPVVGKALLYIQKDSLSNFVSLGDEILIKSQFNNIGTPKNPSEFNYANYLSNHSIHQQTYLNSDEWKGLTTNYSSIYSYSNRAREHLLFTLTSNGVKDDSYAIASALLLGDKDELDYEIKRSYSSAGAMHVLAVSGLHVGIVFLLLNTLLSVFDRSKKGRVIKAVILILSLWLYALLTGLSPSVLRAATMFSFVIVGTALNKQSSIYNTLAASAFFLLIINPNLLFEVGFQLSYLAVLGIVYLQPIIYNKIYTRWWLLDKIWAITAVSIAAQIATLPLTLYYFNQFPTYFMLSNIIVIPAAMVILCLGILLFITSPLPQISEPIGWVLNKFIQGLNFGVKNIEDLPYSVIDGISISAIECSILFIIIFLIVFGLQHKRRRLINYSLLLMIGFVVNDLFEDIRLLNSKNIVVYHINKNQAIDFIDGNQNTLLATNNLINDEKKLSFHIKPNWAAKDLKNSVLLASDSNYIDTVLMNKKLRLFHNYSQFYDKKVVRIGEHFNLSHLENKIDVDYILLSENTNVRLKNLYKMFNFKSIIIDGSNSLWNRNRVIIEAEELNIKLINTDYGAFVEVI